jgi:hypothetical protein
MTPVKAGDVVLVNGDGDLAMDASIAPFIGEVLDVEKVAKSGLVVLTTPAGTISVPRRNLTILRISTFPSTVGKGTPIKPGEAIQIYEDTFPYR